MAAKRIAFILGLGAGYVLGAKAGRQRYQQIVGKAQDVWQNPNVQAKADQAQHLAKDKAGQAGSAVAGTVKEKAGAVGSTIADKVNRTSDDDSSSGGSHARSDVPTPEEVSLGGTDGGVDADLNSPSDKLPPHPVAKPGVPGGSPE